MQNIRNRGPYKNVLKTQNRTPLNEESSYNYTAEILRQYFEAIF